MTTPKPKDGGTEWPILLRQQVGPGYVGWQNFAVAGQTLAQMLEDQQIQVIPACTKNRAILMVWGGINDLHHGSNADALATMIKAYHQRANSNYITTFAFTLTASQYAKYAPTENQRESERLKFNRWLRTNWQKIGADALVDLAADKRIGNFDSVANRKYFQADKLHMNQGGRAVVAELVKAQL
ncbi:SGNH/GDSL hydrolase family protein [Adhaeribacter swui]|uniref:SGNH/GDSL hydrolase family protein n=2 Tax=Adhaeribacter swui TaxID=2086471 RepID=A0A7G7GB64_9BACT|nr:SGNH/GDSL hydrolase family protein [Adhaeribacter swui]QNF34398.1 SGNH/GDSL hydrolase family protein [Adhaeribacter swui]